MHNFAIEYNFAVPCPPSDSKFTYPTLMISDDDLVCYFDMKVDMTKRKKCQFLIISAGVHNFKSMPFLNKWS